MFSNDVSAQLILNYEGQLPRYTSYPTVPHFSAEVNGEVYSQWLTALPAQDSLSLYIHIPFCKQLCWYCGCFTKVTHKQSVIADYVAVLKQEIALVSAALSTNSHRVTNIHFGGGSPTILSPQLFLDLMQTIAHAFNLDLHAEIAIEVDPRTITEEKIKTYAEARVNRVSIGAQDFNTEVQQAIHREQSFELIQSCIKLFKLHGIHHINLDLIYGLPKQTLACIANNIDAVFQLNPSRIVLFCKLAN